jgi:prophage antirepressor-like protein
LGKLQALSDTFHDTWVPLCRKFTANPPHSSGEREKEHRKLSESVMTHIILKADAIEVDSSDARLFRKGLLKEVNDEMKKIDATAKA